MRDLEGGRQQLTEKNSYKMKEIVINDGPGWDSRAECHHRPKYIEDYNRAMEDILEKVKLHDKLKTNSMSSSLPRKTSWKKEDFDIEEEVRKLKEKNMLRKSTMLSDKHDDIDARKVKIEVKPSFTERYLQKQIDRKIDVPPQQEVKKGAWRKDFARYEEDLEIKKLRKETEKKISSLDCESLFPGEESSILTKIPVKIIEKQPQKVESKPKQTKFTNHNPENDIGKKTSEYSDNSQTTFVTVKLNPDTQRNSLNTGVKIDASLTIKKNVASKKIDINDDLKIKSQDAKNDSVTRKVQGKANGAKFDASADINKDSDDISITNKDIQNRVETKRGEHSKSEIKVKECQADLNAPDEKTRSTEEGLKEAGTSEGGADEEDEDGMRAMRRETRDTFANMEAEFEAGRSKLAAVRARIRRAREMAKAAEEE